MESAAEQHGADRTEPGIHDADDTLLEGLSVDASRPEQPVLREADGTPVRTWRENYPYDRKLRRREYERRKRVLQIELLKLQSWVKETGARIVIVCEGRDAAGKGGTIKRFTERLNPRGARVVALDKPTEKEAGQWYFQRYIAHLPSPGRSSSSTGPGTTGPGSSGSWGSAPRSSTSSSSSRRRCSRR